MTHLLIRQSWSFFSTKNEKSGPKMGSFFFNCPKYSFIVAFIFQLTQKPQQRSLYIYEVIEDILLIVLNTKRPLWRILGSQDINRIVLGVFSKINFCQIHPKLFCWYLGNHESARGHFVFKTNGRISSIITSYKAHCCDFCVSWDIKPFDSIFFPRNPHCFSLLK